MFTREGAWPGAHASYAVPRFRDKYSGTTELLIRYMSGGWSTTTSTTAAPPAKSALHTPCSEQEMPSKHRNSPPGHRLLICNARRPPTAQAGPRSQTSMVVTNAAAQPLVRIVLDCIKPWSTVLMPPECRDSLELSELRCSSISKHAYDGAVLHSALQLAGPALTSFSSAMKAVSLKNVPSGGKRCSQQGQRRLQRNARTLSVRVTVALSPAELTTPKVMLYSPETAVSILHAEIPFLENLCVTRFLEHAVTCSARAQTTDTVGMMKRQVKVEGSELQEFKYKTFKVTSAVRRELCHTYCSSQLRAWMMEHSLLQSLGGKILLVKRLLIICSNEKTTFPWTD